MKVLNSSERLYKMTGDKGKIMNRYIRKMLTATLGAALVAMCVPAQAVMAAPTEAAETTTPEITMPEATTPEATTPETTAPGTTTPGAITAPVLTAESIGYDSVTLTWEPVDQAVKYVLQQSFDGKKYTTVASRKVGQTMSYTASGLYTAHNYYYRLTVKSADGAKAVSDRLKVKPKLPAPTVTKLKAGTYNSIDIEWTAVEGAAFYRVYRSTTKTGGYKSVKTVYTTSYTNKVSTGVTYFYKIMPLRYNPDGAKVRGACSTPQSVAATLQAPVISSVTNTAGNSLTVSWNSVPEADGYVIYRSLIKTEAYEPVGETGKDAGLWTDTTVEAGTKYYYKLCAVKTIKGEKHDGALSVAKSKWTVSGAPADVVVTQNGGETVSLSWAPSKAASSYRIYRAVGTNGKYTRIATKVMACSYTDSGLTMGETYSYVIKAVHGSLLSTKSKAVSIKVGKIEVNTRTLYLGPGTTGVLSATSELPGTISWSSADPSVAAVNADGTVVGVAPGKTQILVSVDTVTTSVNVTVTDCQLNGIDVSKWQQAIDWETVKASGIRFAMLRLAHGTSKDIQFENYYTGAKEQGIPVGIYCYTLAKSVDEGIEEANTLLEMLDGKQLDYPIALDLESENQIKNMNKAARTELILAYKQIIEEAGYQFVVYANLNWLNNYIDQTKLEEEDVDIWIARYCSQSLGHRYEGGGNVRMWQYSSTGQVDGILDAYGRYINVDLDVCYDEY